MRRRWFQFRLRTLLGFLVLLCILLGAWSLYWTYFGPIVKAAPVIAGKPILVEGRFLDFLGPDSTVFIVQVTRPMKDGRPLICQSGSGRVARSGLWSYDFEVELAPIREPGDYDLVLRPSTSAHGAASKKGQRLPGIRRMMTVLPGTNKEVEQR
jgi:hypothetical protein